MTLYRAPHAESRAGLPQILLVDDDQELCALVGEVLTVGGFDVETASNGIEMRRQMDRRSFDLVVLDLNLAGEDGLVLCRELRTRTTLPVIMLTARADPIDRIIGLELGADDYIGKPFEPRELLARVRTVLRRNERAHVGTFSKRISQALFEGWRLDLDHRHLIDPGRMLVMLSGAEYNLLRAMVEQPQQVLSREQLAPTTGPRDLNGRAMDIQISRLRHKLRDGDRLSPLIKTVRGEGYVFAAPVSFE